MSAMSETNFEIADLFRRVENLIRRGKVSALQTDPPRVRVSFGDAETDWLPWLTQRAGTDRTWWAPSVGEQIVVFAESGDPRNGVVLPGLYQAAHPAPEDDPDIALMEWDDGARASYNRATHTTEIELPAAGEFTVRVGKSTLSMTSGQILLKTPHLAIVEGE